jgi:hypothetical protein
MLAKKILKPLALPLKQVEPGRIWLLSPNTKKSVV